MSNNPIIEEFLKKYRSKSKQPEEIFKWGFWLKVHPGKKLCDNCGDLVSPTGKEFIALIGTNGTIFYFCSLDCVHDFIKQELEERKLKSGGMII